MVDPIQPGGNGLPFEGAASSSYDGLNNQSQSFQNLLETAKKKTEGGDPTAGRATIKKAAKEMETMLVTFMLKEMDKAGGKGLLGESSQGMGFFKDKFFEDMAREMTSQNGLGFAEALANTYGIKEIDKD